VVSKPSLLLESLRSLNKANRKKAYKPYFQNRNISKTHRSLLALEKILEILKDADLRGLFFITGHMAEKLKSRVVEESLLSDEQDSESTIFKFLRTIHFLE
jgi:hypothetical protein